MPFIVTIQYNEIKSISFPVHTHVEYKNTEVFYRYKHGEVCAWVGPFSSRDQERVPRGIHRNGEKTIAHKESLNYRRYPISHTMVVLLKTPHHSRCNHFQRFAVAMVWDSCMLRTPECIVKGLQDFGDGISEGQRGTPSNRRFSIV